MKPTYRNRLQDYGGPYYQTDEIQEATRWAREAQQREQDARNGNGIWFCWGFVAGIVVFTLAMWIR